MTFPVSVLVSWDPNPAADAVINYNVSLDGAVVGAPTDVSLVVPVATPGSHTFAVTAVNEWGESDPASVTVVINPAGVPTGVKIKKA